MSYDDCAGIIEGPFRGCDCRSHHNHGPQGIAGCPVCNPPKVPCDAPNHDPRKCGYCVDC